MEYRVIISAIIHENFKKILLIKRKREPFVNKWSLMGGAGALKKEKDPNKAIILEVYQDLGVKFNGEFYTFLYNEQLEPTIELFFQGTIEGKPFINSKDTISEIKWFDINEALKLELAFRNNEILGKFKKDFLPLSP
jgi:ADP-ribose pyrophosphatase YjhB (NUDIX family)